MGLSKVTAEPQGLAKRAVWLTAANGLAFTMALLLPLLLVRKLSQAEFGLYKQAFQILATAVSLLYLNVSTSAYYFMPREPERKPQVVLNILIFYLMVGSALALLFFIYPQWVTLIFNSSDLVPIITPLGLAILLWLVAVNLECIMVANGDIRWSSTMIVCMQLLKTSLLIGAATIFGNVRAMVIAAIILGVVHCTILFVYLHDRFGDFWRRFDWRLFKAQLSNALPFGMGGVALVIQSDLHNYYVSHEFSPTEFAIYSVGCSQLPLLVILFNSVDSALFPEIAQLEKEGARGRIIQVWAKGMRLLALAFFPVCALLFLVRHEFITTLFTASYAAATPIFAINLFILLLMIAVSNPVLRAFADFKYFRLKFNLMMLPVTWCALYVGIKTGGLVGAVTAVALTRLLDVGVTTILLGQRLGMGRKHARHFAPLARLTAATMIAALATAGAKLTLGSQSGIKVLGLSSAIFGMTYVISLFAVGAVTGEEKAAMCNLWRKIYRPGSARAELASATEASRGQ
jgi:O-antigen/teichoic acid export membrane protein